MEEKKEKFGVEAVKTVAILVAICVVCAFILALCNDVFYVSPQELTARKLKTVYPEFEMDDSFDGQLNQEFSVHAEYGTVTEVYRSTDGAYVIKAVGKGGYGEKGVDVLASLKDGCIAGWTVTDWRGETLSSNFTSKHFSTWYVGSPSDRVFSASTDGLVSGTTMSSKAIANAMNAICYYYNNVLSAQKEV